MKNILFSILKNKNKCTHKNALINSNSGYCPDCGEYLIKNYYMVRCSRCDIKRQARLFWGEIVPSERFCSNCGSSEYYIEKIDSINFIDAKYAIYLKETAEETHSKDPQVQIWVDENNDKIKQIEMNKLS